MQGNFGLKKLTELLDTIQFRLPKEKPIEVNEVDITVFIGELDFEKTVVVYRMLPKELASDVFACLPVEKREHIINSITDYELNTIINDLFTDDAVDILEGLPVNVVKRVLRNSTLSTRKLTNQFLKYPEGSAGNIVTAEYVDLKKCMTMEEAFAYIRRHGVDKKTIYTRCAMDAKRALEGVVAVKDLLMHPYEEVTSSIMDTHMIKAVIVDDQEEVAKSFREYDLLSLPVADHENRPVGIVTVDDAADVMERETIKDFEKMAAILPSERPYLKAGMFALVKNRPAWLLILMADNMTAGSVLARYRAASAAISLLVTFIPMLADTGGNTGSQNSTMIIQGMAVGEIEARDILRVLWKELKVGVIVSVSLGLVNYVRLVIHFPNQEMLCLTVVLSLLITIMLTKTIGCVLPIVAQALHLDPIIMAASPITTIVDAVSLIIYFQLACGLLKIQGMSRAGILLTYRVPAFFG